MRGWHIVQGRSRRVEGSPVRSAPTPGRATRLTTAVASGAVLALLVAPTVLAARSRPHQALTLVDRGVVSRINAIRIAHGLIPLRVSGRLDAAATAHTTQMVTDGYFGHRTASGLSFLLRLEYYYPSKNASLYTIGENLYWTSTRPKAPNIVTQWMLSPPHRENILSPAWRQIGISAIKAPSAPGVYAGLRVTVVTVDFGTRRVRGSV